MLSGARSGEVEVACEMDAFGDKFSQIILLN